MRQAAEASSTFRPAAVLSLALQEALLRDMAFVLVPLEKGASGSPWTLMKSLPGLIYMRWPQEFSLVFQKVLLYGCHRDAVTAESQGGRP